MLEDVCETIFIAKMVTEERKCIIFDRPPVKLKLNLKMFISVFYCRLHIRTIDDGRTLPTPLFGQ